MFILIPTSGIGNRLRVIASAIKYSQLTGERPYCIWIRDAGLNCRFDTLFEPIPGVYDSGKLGVLFYRFFRLIKRICPKWEYVQALTDYEEDGLKNIINSNIQWRGGKHFLVAKSNSEFCNTTDIDYNVLFRPSRQVMERVNAITSSFQTNTIGLHIRRSDNALAIQNSPLNAFEERIAKLLQQDKNVSFFLATDDSAVQSQLRAKFGEHIIVSNGVKNRDSQGGILQAVAELYALASCDYILGSYWSSFSQIAARLGNKRLEIVRALEEV